MTNGELSLNGKTIRLKRLKLLIIINKRGKRIITADTALSLRVYFGSSPKFWVGPQDDYDIEEVCKGKKMYSIEFDE